MAVTLQTIRRKIRKARATGSLIQIDPETLDALVRSAVRNPRDEDAEDEALLESRRGEPTTPWAAFKRQRGHR